MVIFIDELDRCNPGFAVRLLERIKHYFSNDNITFVFSVNIGELQHAVRCYYGEGFDACRYLDRFFDFRIDLPPANLDVFYRKMGLDSSRWVYEKVCRTVIDVNRFSLRETAKFYRMARAAAYMPMHNGFSNFCFSEEKAVRFCLMYFVPVMIGLKISDYSKYEAFIEGRDNTPLHDVLKDDGNRINLGEDLLGNNETFSLHGTADNRTVVRLHDKLNELYEALFLHQYTSRNYEVRIGDLTFTKETRNELLKAVSTLSEFADYEA